jgi:REP element-mobilizing transposase RayT
MGELHHRKSYRLLGFDYSSVATYFITIHNNHKISFGNLVNGQMILNDFGKIVRDEWLRSEEIRREIVLDDFVIIPNHFHAIVWIIDPDGVGTDGDGVGDVTVGANGHSPLRTVPRPYPRPIPDRVPEFIRPENPYPNPFRMKSKSISSLMTGFKKTTTKIINKITNQSGSVWQRGFHDRIIRDKIELLIKRDYVKNNPMKHFLQTTQKPVA